MSNVTAIHLRPIRSPEASDPEQQTKLSLVTSTSSHAYSQATLELGFSAPNAFIPVLVPPHEHSDVESTTRTFRVDATHSDSEDAFFERQMTSSADLPSVGAFAHRFAQAMVEVIAGQRPPRQLAHWATPTVLSGVLHPTKSERSPARRRTAASRDRSIVTRVRIDEPADGVAEVAAVVRGRERSRALMLRFEGWDGRWICTFAGMV